MPAGEASAATDSISTSLVRTTLQTPCDTGLTRDNVLKANCAQSQAQVSALYLQKWLC